MKPLTELTVGDTVQRNIYGIVQCMIITKVDSNLLQCGLWTFDARNGNEIDEDISTLVSAIESTTSDD